MANFRAARISSDAELNQRRNGKVVISGDVHKATVRKLPSALQVANAWLKAGGALGSATPVFYNTLDSAFNPSAYILESGPVSHTLADSISKVEFGSKAKGAHLLMDKHLNLLAASNDLVALKEVKLYWPVGGLELYILRYSV